MSTEPTLSADALLQQLRGRFEQLLSGRDRRRQRAPAGAVINASEEKVRDLLADFRRPPSRPPSNSASTRASGFFPLRSIPRRPSPSRTRGPMNTPS